MVTQRARLQAESELETIIEMAEWISHLQECSGDKDDCGLSNKEIADRIRALGIDVAGSEAFEAYHDEELAEQMIQEHPLSINVRSLWHSPGIEPQEIPMEYAISLSTGGPATRLVGSLDRWSSPKDVSIQYQDWFTEWRDLPITEMQRESLLTYARQHYFG